MFNRGRIATANGAMLADPDLLGNLLAEAGESLFDPAFWRQRGQLEATPGGRGASYFVGDRTRAWVLRHCRRGGFIANLSADRYVWRGEARVRAFAEWRLLVDMHARALPVPRAVAAGYRRQGLSYTCDLITVRIANAAPLSVRLAAGALPDALWQRIGATLRRFHDAGIDHADLNAHNILCAPDGGVSVIDFDRGRQRRPGAWAQGNLDRLHRSLLKVSAPLPAGVFGPRQWQQLKQGYDAGA